MNIEQARFNMVEQQIRPCNITNQQVLQIMLSVQREKFVPEVKYQNLAFADLNIPLPDNQSMFYPRIEAIILEHLNIKHTDNVLEIGTGSGYTTALLAKMANKVYSIENSHANFMLAKQNLMYAGINNVELIEGNGLNGGVINQGLFDAILIGGGVHTIPDTVTSQLKPQGKLIACIGQYPLMQLVLLHKIDSVSYQQENLVTTNMDYLFQVQQDNFTF